MSITINTIIAGGSFTSAEINVLSFLNENLKNNFGEYFTTIDAGDIAKGIGETIPHAKGVLGSLVKKDVIDTDHFTSDCGTYECFYFVQQEEMDYEPYKEPKPERYSVEIIVKVYHINSPEGISNPDLSYNIGTATSNWDNKNILERREIAGKAFHTAKELCHPRVDGMYHVVRFFERHKGKEEMIDNPYDTTCE